MLRSPANFVRLKGLDSLRFVAAVWVACSHGARAPLEHMIPGDGALSQALIAINNGLFNGVAAVMLFFVISGLVIHHANAGREDIDIANHYARRLLRITPPFIAAQTICLLMGPAFQIELNDVLWSIYCEFAFYMAYPLLFVLFRRVGVERVFLYSALAASFAIAANWRISYHSMLPLWALLVIGLPCLLLGCVLAEQLTRQRTFENVSGAGIWSWRLAAIALSVAMKIPVTHGPTLIGYPAGHWIFAVFAFFWLSREINWFAHHVPPRWMEAGGGMSYSLYLVHFPVLGLFMASEIGNAPLRGIFGHDVTAWFIAWTLQIAMIAFVTVVFHLVVEAPCHRLARSVGKWAGSIARTPQVRPQFNL